MLEISELMEPLEEQIKELEIDHLDQNGTAKLRAVALKDLRYKLPVMHDEYEISDGFGDDLDVLAGPHFCRPCRVRQDVRAARQRCKREPRGIGPGMKRHR